MESDIVTIQQLQRELEQLHDRCERSLLKQNELITALAQVDQRLRSACSTGSDSYRVVDRKLATTEWCQETQNGYATGDDCRKILLRLEIVREVLEMESPEFLRSENEEPTQYYFNAGERFRARQRFFHILSRANHRVDIFDPYLDPEVLDFVDALPTSIQCRLLTGQAKPLFVSQAKVLIVARPSLQVRSGHTTTHDRFTLLDEQEVWHLGASINGLGKKAFMLSRVLDDAESARVIADFSAWWSSGANL